MPRAQLGAGAKRKRADADSDPRRAAQSPPPPAPTQPPPRKRARHTEQHDLLSPLSDELLVRVLSLLSLADLLGLASVSRRFHVLSADSQLWKSLYYARFVLPRALRIPGFRDGSAREGKLHYGSRRTVWADGRRGGWVDSADAGGHGYSQHPPRRYSAGVAAAEGGVHRHAEVGRGDWKRQYKLRHNWSLGKCAVEELNIRTDVPRVADGHLPHEHDSSGARQSGKTLVKVSEGVAVTADIITGLRAWDLKTRMLLAQTGLPDESSSSSYSVAAAAPTCMALDDHGLSKKLLDVAIGFADGSFGVWRVDLARRAIRRRYRHEQASNGGLVGLAYSHPYLLTATKSVLVSLYTFDVPSAAATTQGKPQPSATGPRAVAAGPVESESETERESAAESHTEDEYESHDPRSRRYVGSGSDSRSQHGQQHQQQQSRLKTTAPGGVLLSAPYLMTSLKSHTSRDPLDLSIRKSAGSTTVASIAYTFSTIQGWSLGIQDLHIRPPLPGYGGANGGSSSRSATTGPSPEVVTTRLAYTLPVRTAPRRRRRPNVSGLTARRAARNADFPVDGGLENTLSERPVVREAVDSSSLSPRVREGETSPLHRDSNHAHAHGDEEEEEEEGPTSICYTHPYLLATLPDNTLILHLCTSTSTSLSISPVGIRLWGHTSGISDAEITARGKAVSVSSRGDEIRVWELEGGKVAAATATGAGAGAGRGKSCSSLASQQPGAGGVGHAGLGGTSRRVTDVGGSSSSSGGGGGGGSNEGSSSIAVRPTPKAVAGQEEEQVAAEQDRYGGGLAVPGSGGLDEQWDERRNWVGFDDEMVIVLKESRDGRESLLVYDFT